MQVLAIDLGASNGRGIVADYYNNQIVMKEVHRFSNDPVHMNGYIYWDFPRLYHEILTALINAKNEGYTIESIGIDTWGVDYGIIDTDGELMANPIHYRDERAAKGMEKLIALKGKDNMKRLTGMDCLSYNTVNQLLMERLINDPRAEAILNMPDLFNYFLTGQKRSEYSMITTSQLYDYAKMDWNYELIDELQLPKALFQEPVASGTIVGDVKASITENLGIGPLKVVAVTGHDTAAALQGVATEEDEYLFIATGTWVIVGCKQEQMTINDYVMDFDLANEGGRYPDVNLLKNHVGLWILQESKRYWEKEGIQIGFGEMVEMGASAEINSYIDVMEQRFFDPGDMPNKVKAYCAESGQKVPETIGEIVKVIEQSLAKQIAETLKELETAVNKSFSSVYMFGGGVQDKLLIKLIENYSGKKVVIGPKEATALGNVTDQFIAMGAFGVEERSQILRNSMVN